MMASSCNILALTFLLRADLHYGHYSEAASTMVQLAILGSLARVYLLSSAPTSDPASAKLSAELKTILDPYLQLLDVFVRTCSP
jgi:hypothetical protein